MDSREYTFEGKGADVDESASVSRESTLVGDVTVGPDVTVAETTTVAGSLVARGSVTPSGYEVPRESFVRGTPARVTPLSETDIDRDAVFDQFASGEFAHQTEDHDDLFER